MKIILSVILFTTGLFAGLKHATAAESPDLVCKSQAKEVAKQTYNDCMTTAKAAQADQLRKSYQAKLKNLKSQYEAEMKKVGGSKKTAKSIPAQVSTPVETPAAASDDGAIVETVEMPLPSSDDNTTL